MRNLYAILAGFILGALVVATIEWTGHALFPIPEDIDPFNMDSLRANLHRIPFGSKLFVIIAWGLGSWSGAITATLITASGVNWIKTSRRNSLIVGGILMLGGLVTLAGMPHPAWMWVSGLLIFLPSSWSGWRIATSTFFGLTKIKQK